MLRSLNGYFQKPQQIWYKAVIECLDGNQRHLLLVSKKKFLIIGPVATLLDLGAFKRTHAFLKMFFWAHVYTARTVHAFKQFVSLGSFALLSAILCANHHLQIARLCSMVLSFHWMFEKGRLKNSKRCSWLSYLTDTNKNVQRLH